MGSTRRLLFLAQLLLIPLRTTGPDAQACLVAPSQHLLSLKSVSAQLIERQSLLSAAHMALEAFNSEKLSDGTFHLHIGVENSKPPNFYHIYHANDFDNPPTNLIGAVLRWVFLIPTPLEVCRWLPTMLLWFEEVAEWPVAKAPTAITVNGDSTAVLEASYRPTAGRAGAKVNLRISDVTKTGVLSKIGRRMAETLAQYGHENDWESITAISFMLLDTYSASSHLAAEFILNNHWVFALPLAKLAKLLKSLHTGIRMFGRMPDSNVNLSLEEMRQLYGLDVIIGRSELLPLNVVDEIRMRLVDPTHRRLPIYANGRFSWSTQTQYDEALARATDEAVSEALKPSVKLSTLTEWYDRRMHWAASGGAPGATIRWASDTPLQRMNKRGAVLLIPESHVRNILSTTAGPVLWSKCAPKFENGKNRAIWNTAVEHYLIQCYILDNFESNLASIDWNAAYHSTSTRLKADMMRLTLLNDFVGVMWDYSDFNINHTFPAMNGLYSSAVNRLIKRAIPHDDQDQPYVRRASDDLKVCLAWVNAAKEFSVLEDPASGVMARVTRSLQSGERGTSFCNTFLNKAYTIMVRKWAQKLTGDPWLSSLSFHAGDDAYEFARRMLHAVLACIAYNLLGFAGQLYKITIDYHSRGEFLRSSYNSIDNKIAGYPVRTAMGLLGGEFFRESIADPGARASAFIDQYTKVLRRGGNIPVKLLEIIISSKAALVYTTAAGVKRRITPDLKLLLTPAAFGGYGVYSTDAKAGNESVALVVPDKPQPLAIMYNTPPPGPCVFAVIPSGEGKTWLSQRYPKMCLDDDTLAYELPGGRQLHAQQVKLARKTGDWNPLVRHRQLILNNFCDQHPNAAMILLVGHPDMIPPPYRQQWLGIYLLRQPTAIRFNVMARTGLLKDHAAQVSFHPNFLLRNRALFSDFAHFALLTRTIPLPQYSFDTFTRASTDQRPPKYQPPVVDMGRLFNRPSTFVMDVRSAHELAGPVAARSARQLVGHSALSGAYPEEALNQSLSDFAKSLDKWLNCSVSRGGHQVAPLPPSRQQAAYLHFNSQFVQFFRSLTQPYDRFTVPQLSTHHNYGIMEALTIPAGFSSSSARDDTISRLTPLRYPGLFGQWHRLASLRHGVRTSPIWGHVNGIISPVTNNPHTNQTELIKYFLGKLEFYPPYNFGLGPTLISTFRACVLAYIEFSGALLFNSRLYLTDTVYLLEIVAYQAYFDAMFSVLGYQIAHTE